MRKEIVISVILAWGFQVGTDIYVNPRFGIRFSARVMGTTPASRYYFGDWGDPTGYSGILTYPGLAQFGLNIGFVIGVGKLLPVYHKPVRAQQRLRRDA
jgi:hypothetical protein